MAAPGRPLDSKLDSFDGELNRLEERSSDSHGGCAGKDALGVAMTNRLDKTLTAAGESRRTVLAPYVTIGFPSVDTSVEVAAAVVEAGADMLELGVPFSDPLADGPTVQMTSYRALEQGVNVSTCLQAVRRLRSAGVAAPIALLGYYNPYLRYGTARFAMDAAEAGVDGLIVPDLPPEEARPFQRECSAAGMYVIPLLAPTSTDERIKLACQGAGGFVYCVSVTGVTGARSELGSEVADLVGRIRRNTKLPILVGFGVSTSQHFQAIGRFADGAIVGSALMNVVDSAPDGAEARAAADFVRGLREATG